MDVSKQTLENGLQSVVIPQKDTPTATVMVMVNAGSRHESKKQNGISHFLEHMFFKGTENRPSSHAVSQSLDRLGAESNAFTNYEYTAYYGKVQKNKTDKITEILADIYQNSLFPEEEIKKEAGVITEEIRMYNDLPMRLVQDVFQKHIYANQPLGRSILGTKEHIQNFSRDDFVQYKDTHYAASKTAVIVAGGVSTDEAHQFVSKNFSDTSDQQAVDPKPADPDPDGCIRYQRKDSDQTHVVVGAPTVERKSEQLPAVEILSTLLGRGMSSRLFRILRDKMGVCYYVRSNVSYFTDSGLFKVSTGVTPGRLAEVVDAITETMQAVVDEGVNKDELEKAKEFAIGNFLLGYESTDGVARDIAKQSVLDAEIERPQEHTQKLRSVTEANVKQAAKSILQKGLHAAIIGPQCEKDEIEKALQM